MNLRGENAMEPLHFAAQFGRLDCIKAMIDDFGADPVTPEPFFS